MDGVFARSWNLTKLSFAVIREDKELLIFPFLSAFFSLLVLGAFWVPIQTLLTLLGNHQGSSNSGLGWGLLFILYFLLNFVATFFNVSAVHIIKKRLEGGKEPLSESFAFAFSRVHLIATWSLVAATVSLFFKMLENLIDKKGNGLGWVVSLILSLILGGIEISWTIVTLFVIPAMVYKDMGPIDAVKESTRVIKKTWGEKLARNFAMGLIHFCFLMLGLLPLMAVGYMLVASDAGYVAYGLLAFVTVAYFSVVSAVFSMANTVFNTALYVYGSTGKSPEGFPSSLMESAFRPKG